jgi:hypothetical protein
MGRFWLKPCPVRAELVEALLFFAPASQKKDSRGPIGQIRFRQAQDKGKE